MKRHIILMVLIYSTVFSQQSEIVQNSSPFLIQQVAQQKKISYEIFLTSCAVFATFVHQYGVQAIADFIKDEIATVAGLVYPPLAEYIEGQKPAIANNPYKDQQARVRVGSSVSDGERKAIEHRLPHVKKALENMLGRPLDNVYIPKIACIASGGGIRSLFCTTGFLCGADRIGLLDGCLYMAGVSGGTWALASWLSSGVGLRQFKRYCSQTASESFFDLTRQENHAIADHITVKKMFNQPCTLVDVYGALLANRLLDVVGDEKHLVCLSEQQQKVDSGLVPYPIYTAIDGSEQHVRHPSWYTFTPHEIGNVTYGMYIPSWAYGRHFKDGVSITSAPEQPLGYHLGVWGSALAFSVYDVYEMFSSCLTEHDKDKIEAFLEPVIGKRPFPFCGKIPNYMSGMPGPELCSCKHIKIVDAGFDINFPYPPISGICPDRFVDIMIFVDSSSGQIGQELKKIEEYAHQYGLLFPKIDYTSLDKKTISIFKDEDNPDIPVVIYLPRISDQGLWQEYRNDPRFVSYHLDGFDLDKETQVGFAHLFNFHYTFEQSEQVMEQMEFNVSVHEEIIKDTIEWVINKKSKDITT